jgi:hypothetical protein
MVFSLALASAGCGIERPNSEVCIVNAPAKNRKCYNLKTDYNDDGTLKAGAVAKYHPNGTVEDLNKAMVVDSPFDAAHPNPKHFEDGLARLKTWIKQLRQEYAACQAGETAR